jgi:hypothetical protein
VIVFVIMFQIPRRLCNSHGQLNLKAGLEETIVLVAISFPIYETSLGNM